MALAESTRERLRGYVLTLSAAAGWGTLGLFYTSLNRRYGVAPATIALFRTVLALLILVVLLGVFGRDRLRVRWRDVPLFVALGVVGISAFCLAYAYAMAIAGMSVAVVLMYTAPVWVTLYGWRFLHEGLDRVKVLALAGALLGAALVAQIYDTGQLRLNLLGIAWGLATGLTYAGQIILGKYALRRYSPWTVQVFSQLFGAPLLMLVQPAGQVRHVLTTPGALALLLTVAAGPTVAAGVAYSAGLARLPASVASIVVACEPAIATLLAFVVLGERLAPAQLLGALAITVSIVLLGRRDLAEKPAGGAASSR